MPLPTHIEELTALREPLKEDQGMKSAGPWTNVLRLLIFENKRATEEIGGVAEDFIDRHADSLNPAAKAGSGVAKDLINL